MFPPLTTRRPQKRSLGELVRDAVETALEFATLGEASVPDRSSRPAPKGPAVHPRPAHTAPTSEHPHRRHVGQVKRRRRPGRVAPRAQVCVSPVHRPARRDRQWSRP